MTSGTWRQTSEVRSGSKTRTVNLSRGDSCNLGGKPHVFKVKAQRKHYDSLTPEVYASSGRKLNSHDDILSVGDAVCVARTELRV